MASTADLFNRIRNTQGVVQGGTKQIGGLGQYEGRLNSVRDAYYERLEAERRRKYVADATAWEQAVARNQPRAMANDLLSAGIRGIFGAGGGGGGGDIDRFMAAISGQESGGNYNAHNPDSGASGRFQIMPGNWPSWAREAGLGANAPRTPQNQDRVARYKMQQYYNQTNDWGLVARMWYAGPGSLNYSPHALSRRQGGGKYPSINDYVASVMGRMR